MVRIKRLSEEHLTQMVRSAVEEIVRCPRPLTFLQQEEAVSTSPLISREVAGASSVVLS